MTELPTEETAEEAAEEEAAADDMLEAMDEAEEDWATAPEMAARPRTTVLVKRMLMVVWCF